MADHHDVQFMSDLAKIFEDDHEMHPAVLPAQPVSQQHSGTSQKQLVRPGDTPSPPMDPFLLPGDEQTWDLADWEWDPYGLNAAPKDQANVTGQCCQALKRRKLPAEVMAGVPNAAAAHAGHCATPQQQPSAFACPPGMGAAPMVAATAVSCCSFQMPPGMAAPQQPGAGDMGMPAARSSHAGVYGAPMPGMAPNPAGAAPAATPGAAWPGFNPAMPWQQPGLAPAMMAGMAMAPNFYAAAAAAAAAGMQQSMAQQRPPSMPGSAADSLSGLGRQGSAAAVNGKPGGQQQPMVRHVLHHSSSHNKLSSAKSGSVPPPVIITQTKSASGNSQNSAGTVRSRQAAAAAAAQTKAALAQSAAAAAAADAAIAGQQQQGSDGESSDEEAEATAGRKRPAGNGALAPATYTGSLDGVVSISDHCPDEASRMMCQVAGCGKDLGPLKEYHQRYRICEVHIKLPQVLKEGRLQRFCQQCGRFHPLEAFDGTRRSCRAMLQRHNARRAKKAQETAGERGG